MTKAKRFLSMLLALCLVLGLVPTMAFAADGIHPFTDVSDTAWYSDAVQYVYEHDMMVGTSSTKFSPDSPTSRGMIVTILHRLEGLPSATGTAFSDVPAGQWYTDAVAWASANNIVNGYGNGKFGPNDPITREQMAAILYRYAEYKEYDTSITGSAITFADGEQVSAYAVDAVNWAIGVGLLQGVGNNKLSPASGATRAQTATILMRFCQSIAAPEYHTVTFEYNYGSKGTYDTVTVEHGKTVIRPTNPTRSGYTFSGWYTEASGGSKFDFSTAITSDFTLYAHWTSASSGSGDFTPSPTTYTVTFDSNGGSAVTAQAVENGTTVIPPANPTKEGYVFVGWYSDNTLENVYDFSTAVTANITLYAKWNLISENDQLFVSVDAHISLPNEDSIVVDPESGIEFVNNELIVHAQIGADRGAVVALLNTFGGEIIGEISATDTYQVQFLNSYTYAELASLQSALEKSPLISWTSANLVFEEKSDYYPVSDTKWASDWSDSTPDGLNWGVEAIDAPNAWNYRDIMSYVNVGVFDCCFYEHEDLVYSKTYFNDVANCSGDSKAHGTHVSGTIAAGFDNGVGITGTAPYVNLYGFAYTGTVLKGKSTLIIMELSVTALLHNDKCQVLNCSNSIIYDGKEAAIWAAERNANYTQAINTGAQELGSYLKRLIDLGDNFVICVAAGNDNDNIYTSTQGVSTSGNVDAFYSNFYTAITDAEVKSRIIVVGACKNDGDGTYTYSNFSNVGSRVNVVAPGEKIYSTINNNGYEAWPGTSMATPHVAGVAAMLYAINPNLTGDQVKKIIVDTANTDVSGCSYKMVNAKNAVEYVARQISGRVVSDGTGISLAGVTVYLNCIFGEAGADIGATTTTASDGTFKLTIPENATAVTGIQFEKDGYSSYLFPLVANVNSSFDIGTVRLTPIAVDPIITPAISGTVRDADTGLALNNVEVYGYDADGYGPLFTGHTGSDGAFSIALEESGTYSMKFNKEGYEEYILSDIVVTSGTALVGTISLTATQLPDDGIIYISTPEQFDAIRNDLTGNYALATDINLSSYTSWDPIGSNSDSFSGTLDGRGHKITGLTITKDVLAQESRVGLFNTVSGTIKDLTVENAEIRVQYGYSIADTGGYTYWGIVAGMLTSSGTIDNCSVSGNMLVDYIGCINAGGIAGGGGNITNCQSACDIDFTLSLSNSTWVIIGGITGYDGKIKDCINRGDVSLTAHLSGRAADQYFYQGNTNWITVDGIGLASKENCTNTGSVRKNVY